MPYVFLIDAAGNKIDVTASAIHVHVANVAAVNVANVPEVIVTDGTDQLELDASGRPTVNVNGTVTVDCNSSNVTIDNDEVVTIDYAHEKIHDGEHFVVRRTNAAVVSGAHEDIRIVVGATRELHAIFTVETELVSVVKLYESPTVSVGTAITPYDLNRTTSNSVTDATFYHSPTVTAVGTTDLDFIYMPAGNTARTSSGASVSTRMEWILKKSTTYLFRVKNNHGSNNSYTNMRIHFYEHS